MLKSCTPHLALILITGLVVSACGEQQSAQFSRDANPANFQTAAPVQASAAPEKSSGSTASTASAATTSRPDSFQLAVARAASAARISQSAQSRDDWRLVADRWQQAILLIKTVPTSSPNRAQAQQKLGQYQQKLAYAQRQASRPTAPINPNGVVLLPPSPVVQTSRPISPAAPIVAAAPQTAPPPESPRTANRRFSAPIVRREGNTPVIRVMFNNKQPFDMIVDTGASGTLITRQMASQLGVVPVSQANVDTASQRNVKFPLGYLQSIAVGEAVASNVLVAVAGPELDVGLLGHDFFGKYDVTIREREVEFQER